MSRLSHGKIARGGTGGSNLALSSGESQERTPPSRDRVKFKLVLNAGWKVAPTWPASTPGNGGSGCLILAESPMPDTLLSRLGSASAPSWIGDLTRVPYWVYRDAGQNPPR